MSKYGSYEEYEKEIERLRKESKDPLDEDLILTKEDFDDILQAEKEYREGKTISYKELRKELGL